MVLRGAGGKGGRTWLLRHQATPYPDTRATRATPRQDHHLRRRLRCTVGLHVVLDLARRWRHSVRQGELLGPAGVLLEPERPSRRPAMRAAWRVPSAFGSVHVQE
jgi:hypothetical protein